MSSRPSDLDRRPSIQSDDAINSASFDEAERRASTRSVEVIQNPFYNRANYGPRGGQLWSEFGNPDLPSYDSRQSYDAARGLRPTGALLLRLSGTALCCDDRDDDDFAVMMMVFICCGVVINVLIGIVLTTNSIIDPDMLVAIFFTSASVVFNWAYARHLRFSRPHVTLPEGGVNTRPGAILILTSSAALLTLATATIALVADKNAYDGNKKRGLAFYGFVFEIELVFIVGVVFEVLFTAPAHLATTLILQAEIKALEITLGEVQDEEDIVNYAVMISATRKRWERFLAGHGVMEGCNILSSLVADVLAYHGSPEYSSKAFIVNIVMNHQFLVIAYLVMQYLPFAVFNSRLHQRLESAFPVRQGPTAQFLQVLQERRYDFSFTVCGLEVTRAQLLTAGVTLCVICSISTFRQFLLM